MTPASHAPGTGKNNFMKMTIFWSWILLAFAVAYQYIFWEDRDNMIALGSVVLAWYLLCNTFLRFSMLKSYPFSAFLVTGFTATQFYFPLVFTSVEGKPLVFNLDLPFQVFFHSMASLVVLMASHLVYRSIMRRPGFSDTSLLMKTGLFDPPAPFQLWIMGFIGLAATFYVYLYAPTIASGVTGSASDKAIQALMPFSYAPFFIPFGRMYGSREPLLKSLLIPLAIFSLLLFLISLGRNSRGGFMIGFSSLGFAYAMGLLLGIFKTKLITLKNGLVAVGLVWLFTGPVADIGTAMVLVRVQRNDISYKELISLTLQAYQDKDAIRRYREDDFEQKTDWDETYLNNPILARFSNVKFNDASLVQASKTGEKDPAMRAFLIDYFWAALPQPLLQAFSIHIDKVMLKSVSVGDYLYYRAGGPVESLGGYRTGHFAGTGMAAFGWWYLLILGLGIIPVFILFDKFFIYKKLPIQALTAVPPRGLRFSLCGMLSLDSAFRFLPAESVVTPLVFLMRDWIQLVVLYLLIYHFTRLLITYIPRFSPSPGVSRRLRTGTC